MSLSTEQLLLLNTLMYMTEKPLAPVLDHSGATVREWIGQVDLVHIDAKTEYDCFIIGSEWLQVLRAVNMEPLLLNMHIAATHVDNGPGGGRGHSAVFLNYDTRDAVVVFKGTQSPEEWGDNFAGFNLSDTPQQINALTWFRQVYDRLGLDRFTVTVTGHSKGGNKSKYVSVLDSRVHHCVSFDGQGFSDLFTDKYARLLSMRERIIENHSAEYDFVNFLFNAVGSEAFYIASPLENSGFARSHSPCAMMHFLPEGGFHMVPSPHGQGPGIAAMSRFSDSFFQSLTPQMRDTSFQTVDALRKAAFSLGDTGTKDLLNVFLPLLGNPAYTDDLAYLLAFTVKYEQHYPEFIRQLQSLLIHFGLDDFTRYIVLVDGILNLDLETPLGVLTFDSIFNELSRESQNISPGLLAILLGWAFQQGINVTPGQLRQLLAVLPRVKAYMDTIVLDGYGESRYAHFSPNSTTPELERISRSLEFLGTVMGGSAPGQQPKNTSKLRRAGSRLRTIGQVTGHISSAFQELQPPPPRENEDIIDV